MKLKYMRKIGKFGALSLLLICMSSSKTRAGENVEQLSPNKKVIALFRACISDEDKKTSFKEFVAQMIKVLEDIIGDPEKLAAFKKEFPNLDAKVLIVALQKVQQKTSAFMIGFVLKPFFQVLPKDLQDYGTLYSGLTKRLAIK